MERKENETNVVAWSTDQQQLQDIAILLKACDDSFKANSWDISMDIMIALKFRIIHSLSPDEISQLNHIESSVQMCKNLFWLSKNPGAWRNNVNVNSDTYELINRALKTENNDLDFQAKNYKTLLMNFLDKYNYLSKKKEDKTEMGG